MPSIYIIRHIQRNVPRDSDAGSTPLHTNDETFEKWVSDQVLKETEELINGMENGQNLNKFEPTDEIFERIVKEARERGLLTEDDVDDVNRDE